jgi:hypothetical protein
MNDQWQFFRTEMEDGRHVFAAVKGSHDEALARLKQDDPIWRKPQTYFIGSANERRPGLLIVADLGATPWVSR